MGDSKVEGDNFKLHLVNRPTDIILAWGTIKDGFEKVLASGNGDETLDYILQQIFNGTLLLWVGFDSDEYMGFFTTKKVVAPYKGKQVGTLIVNHAYKKNANWNRSIQNQVDLFIDNHAKMSDCKVIKMYTQRVTDRYWNKFGYNRGYTEYIKEI